MLQFLTGVWYIRLYFIFQRNRPGKDHAWLRDRAFLSCACKFFPSFCNTTAINFLASYHAQQPMHNPPLVGRVGVGWLIKYLGGGGLTKKKWINCCGEGACTSPLAGISRQHREMRSEALLRSHVAMSHPILCMLARCSLHASIGGRMPGAIGCCS